MKKIKVLVLQNWFDISIQYTGNVYNAFAIAIVNNRSITDNLTTGELILIPNELFLSNKVLQYYQARKIIPATDYNKEFDLQGGIGTMAIGSTFKVA